MNNTQHMNNSLSQNNIQHKNTKGLRNSGQASDAVSGRNISYNEVTRITDWG